MKTMIKKSLALILTALILVSADAAGITAFAADSTEVVGTLGIETKLFRYDEVSGDWVETDRARRGEILKARVYVDTDYCTNSGRLMVFYDDAFFVDNYMRDEIVEVEANPYYKDMCSMTTQLAFYSKNGNAIKRMIEDELFTEEFAMTHTCIGIMYMYAINAYNERLNGEEWLVEFELTVREDTELTEGSFFTLESVVCTPDNIYAFADVPYGRAGEMIEHTDPLYSVYVDMYFNNRPVSLNSNVIFDANGGYFSGDTIETVYRVTEEIGTEVYVYDAPFPQFNGFVFIGWSFSDNYAELIENPVIPTDYEDITLYAAWEEAEYLYKIVFDANEGLFENGTSEIIMNYPVGAEIIMPDAPTREGFVFNGWVDEYGAPFNPTVMPESNIVLYADWVPLNTYTVTFFLDEDGTEIYLEEAYTEGDSLVYPAPPALPGYTFDSWSEVEGAEITGDLYVYPTYTANEYNITVLGLYGDVFDGWVAFYGDTVTLADLFSKEDMDAMLADNGDYYTFDGWNYNGTAMTADTVITVTDDVEIEGSFTAMDAKLIFDASGAAFANGESTYEVSLKYDDIITEDMYPETPEYEGHKFKAWSLDLVGQPMDELEKTISITWVKNEYPVNYIIDGNVYTTVFAEYGTTVDATVTPEASVIPAGYTFLGWSLIENSSVPDDLGKVGDTEVNVYAVLEPQQGITYTVNLYTESLDGTYELADTIVYADGETGKNAPFVAEPIEGFTFNYDLSVVDIPVAGDGSTVLLAYYNRNSYTLITHSDDEILFEQDYRYGEEIDFIYPPEKEGFTFSRWIFRETGEEFIFPFAMPAENVELEAVWSVNNYTVSFNTDGGAEIEPMNVAFGDEFILPTAEKTGCSFAFWRGPDGSAYSAGQRVIMPADDMEFKAVWLVQSRKVTFIIGKDTFSFDVVAGQEIPMPDMSAYENFEILYWLDNNGKKAEIPDVMPESNLTFTAKLRYICGGNPYGVTASYESGCFSYEGDELRFEVEKINGSREPGGVYFSGENYKQIALYNIKFYHGNEIVQPQNGNKVQISIPVPVAYKNSTSFMVIHRFAGGGYERFSVNKNGDALVFTVGSFSEFEILVKSETAIKTKPSKTAYNYKQTLDLTGLTLEVLDENGNKTVISDTSLMTINGYNPKKIGTQTLIVEYDGTSAQFDVTVKYAWWQMIIRILLLGFLWY